MLRNLLIPITVALISGCASTPQSQRADLLGRPVDCASAESDIAALREAIPGANERIASGVRLAVPVSLAAELLIGDVDALRESASGQAEERLRARIAAIEAACPAAKPAVAKPVG